MTRVVLSAVFKGSFGLSSAFIWLHCTSRKFLPSSSIDASTICLMRVGWGLILVTKEAPHTDGYFYTYPLTSYETIPISKEWVSNNGTMGNDALSHIISQDGNT